MGSQLPRGPGELERLRETLAPGGLRLARRSADQPFTVVDAQSRRSLGLVVYLAHLGPSPDRAGRVAVEFPPGRAIDHRNPVLVLGEGRRGDNYVLWLLPNGGVPQDRLGPTVDASALQRAAQDLPDLDPDGDIGPVVLHRFTLPILLLALANNRGSSDDQLRSEDLSRGRDGGETYYYSDLVNSPGAVLVPSISDPHDHVYSSLRPPRPERPTVETGFASLDRPGTSLDVDLPLPRNAELLFWFAIGSGRSGAIDVAPQRVPGSAPGLPLTVQLFGFDGELQPIGPTQGQIVLGDDERSLVDVPAATVSGTDDGERVLYFPVRTPPFTGPARMRCHVYSGSTLVQSHLVTAHVGDVGRFGHRPPSDGPVLRTEVDYRLADSLLPADLERLPGHDLSLLVNGNETSHQLRVFADLGGEAAFANDASLSAQGLEAAIDNARAALCRSAWGTDEEWADDPRKKPAGQAYRYDEPPRDDPAPHPLPDATINRLAADLIDLARHGSRLYIPLVDGLAGGFDARQELERFLTLTRRIQIASAASGMYVPAAIFYDHLLDDGVETGFHLCGEFRRALEQGTGLEELACLREGCAERDELLSVCVSGFWGFRHDIGWPLSSTRPLTELVTDDGPDVLVGISTDPLLERRDEHIKRIGALANCSVADDRDRFAAALQQKPPPTVIYLYCHGGLTSSDVPYLEIGAANGPAITQAFWRNHRIRFTDPDRRPLVFVNGCHTTALRPAQVVNLVDGFVREANAVGAIGTELTVFEPLAVAFGEAVMRAFLSGSTTIGAAVRHARLQLLQQGNPLGLVYVPFVAADTRIVIRASRGDAAERDVTAAA